MIKCLNLDNLYNCHFMQPDACGSCASQPVSACYTTLARRIFESMPTSEVFRRPETFTPRTSLQPSPRDRGLASPPRQPRDSLRPSTVAVPRRGSQDEPRSLSPLPTHFDHMHFRQAPWMPMSRQSFTPVCVMGALNILLSPMIYIFFLPHDVVGSSSAPSGREARFSPLPSPHLAALS